MTGGSSNDPMMKSSLSAMIHKTVLIASKTTVGQDGIVHSYCCLKLSDLPTRLKDNGSASTSRYAHTRASRIPRGVPPAFHNLGPPSYRCSKCDATMWAPYTFRINGQNYHRIGSLLPAEGVPLRYAQLYFFDTQNEIRNMISAFMEKETTKKVDENTIAGIIQMSDRSNALAQSF
ncbi:hypothetical protein Tco_1279709 [Tanacetum coccineum]